MRKISILLILVIFFSISCFAQSVKINGNIRSKIEVLPSATIQLKNFIDQDLLFYGASDDNGNYTISGTLDESSKYLLIASYIGFKRDTIVITRSDLLKSTSRTYSFTLAEDAKQLDEIYIKAPPNIEINEDTTKYNVGRFTSQEDKNLESVIKKMPGMEVDKNGTISFKGKRIEKILLEGDDLTGEGYKAITKNLKPQFVEEVQAIEHYVEDDLLKGIINSDDIVLNLKIKDKKAKKIVGSVDAGLGTNDRRMLNTNLISFVNKTKAFAYLNHSNLNDQSTNLLELANEDKGFNSENKITRHDVGTYNPFDGTLYTINNTTSGSLNAITRISEKFKINYSLFYYWSKLYGQTSLKSTYFAPISIATQDNDIRNSLNKTFKANFSADYLVKNNARFWAKFTYKQEPKKISSNALSIFNNIAADSVLQNQYDLGKKFNGQIKYTVKANKTMAYLLSAKILVDDVNQDYHTSSQLYQNIPIFNGSQNLFQKVNNQNFKLRLDFEGLKRYNISFLYFNVGNEINHFKINSNLFRENPSNHLSVGNEFVNKNTFKVNQSYAIGKYVYDKQPVKILAQLKYTLLVLKNMERDSTYINLEPILSFSYKLSETQNLALSYNYKNTNPEPIEYYENYVLTDLRSFNSGLINFYNYNTHLLGLNYNFNDFSNSYFTFNFSTNGSYSRNGFLYTNSFIDRLSYAKKEPFKGVKTLNANFNVKKFLPIFSLSLTANYAPSISTYYSKIGADVKEFNSVSQLVMFKINTGFNLPINFGIGTEFQTNQTRSQGNSIAKNFANNYTLDYRYKVTSRIFNLSSLDMYRVNGDRFNLIDTEFQYNPIKGAFKYSLQGKNLANINKFSSLNISETYSSNYSSTILGRYILFNISMSIK